MPNYLAEKDWKAELGKKEHKEVKKTGISEALRDYEKAVKSGNGVLAGTIDKLVEAAKKAQTKYPADKTLNTYLGEIVKAANVHKDSLSKPKEDEDDKDLATALASAKRVTDPERGLNFICAPGKTTGLVLSRRTLGASEAGQAKDQRGKGVAGPVHRGRAYGEDGKIVFNFEPQAPPSGIAKALQKAVRASGSSAKVLVRGAGVSFDEDSDVDAEFESPFEQATGLTDHKQPAREPTGLQRKYLTMAEWDERLRVALGQPLARREIVMDGLRGFLRRDRETLQNDTTLANDIKQQKRADLDEIARRIDLAMKQPDPAAAPANGAGGDPVTTYLSRQEWETRIDAACKLPAAQRPGAVAGLVSLVRQQGDMLRSDKTLPADQQRARFQVLREASVLLRQRDAAAARRTDIDQVMANKLVFIEKATFVKGSAAALGTRPELTANGRLDDVRQALAACEEGVTPLKLNAVRAACDAADAKLEPFQAGLDRGFPQGTSADTLENDGLERNETFRKCAAVMKGCEDVPSENSYRNLRDICAAAQTEFTQARARATDPDEQDRLDATLEVLRDWRSRGHAYLNEKEIRAQGKASLQARTQARLADIAAQYRGLGPAHAWSREQEEIASDLHAAYLFEEGTVSRGANFGAAPTGEASGASGSYWVERELPPAALGADGRAPAKRDRFYIFKPVETEANTVAGLPPGSGAAREVIAKDLADYLAGTGLRVDVCQTNLVRVDAHKIGLGGEPRVGAMQRLGANEGGIANQIKGDATFAARVDKKELDQLAVFDLIIGNLDRHGGNLLVAGDVATKPELIPIDHGTSMPSVDSLKLNRSRILYPQNALMEPTLTQNAQKLNPEAQAALRAINPADMAKTLRDAQARLAGRHTEVGQPKMGLEEPQIKLMTRTVQFMQAAADKLTVRELFTAKAYYLDEIMAEPEPDWNTLVTEVQKKVAAREAGLVGVGKLIPMDTNAEIFPPAPLQSLGWCLGMPRGRIKQWVQDNPELVRKILAGNIENPKLQAEADRLREVVGKPADPNDRRPLTDQIKSLYEAVGNPPANQPAPTTQEYNQLGGDKALDEARAFASTDHSSLKNMEEAVAKATSPQRREVLEARLLADKVALLHRWKQFVELGGPARFIALGGAQVVLVKDAVQQLIMFAVQEDAKASVEANSNEAVAALQAADSKRRAQEARAMLDQFKAPPTLDRHKQTLIALIKQQQAGDADGAQVGLKKLGADMARDLNTERAVITQHRENTTKLRKQLDGRPGAAPKQLDDELTALSQLSEVEILTTDSLAKRVEVLGWRLEHALDDGPPDAPKSDFGKLSQQLKEVGNRLALQASKPFHGALAACQTMYTQQLQAFQLDYTLKNGVKSLGKACECAEKAAAYRTVLQARPGETELSKALDGVDVLLGALASVDSSDVNSLSSGVAKVENALANMVPGMKRLGA